MKLSHVTQMYKSMFWMKNGIKKKKNSSKRSNKRFQMHHRLWFEMYLFQSRFCSILLNFCEISAVYDWLVGCMFKSNCYTKNLGLQEKYAPWCGGVGLSKEFQSEFTRVFEKNHGKLRTARSTNATGNWTRHLSSASYDRRAAPPLVGRAL